MLRENLGGFQLAQRILLSDITFDRARSFYIATQAIWSWYTREVRFIKSPDDGLAELIRLSGSDVALFEELSALIYNSLENQERLVWAGFRREAPDSSLEYQQTRYEEHVEVTLALLYQRGWAKFEQKLPPLCYAGLTTASNDVAANGLANTAAALMQSHNDIIQILDVDALTDPDARDMRKLMLPWIEKACMRILYLVWESYKFNPILCGLGQRLLRCFLLILPDSRIVEEVHQYLRDLNRNNRNNINNRASLFGAAVHSGVLESRGIPHLKVSKSEFIAKYGERASKKSLKHAFRSQTHKLPERMSKLMLKGDWASPTVETTWEGTAAWLWETVRSAEQPHFAAWYSRILPTHTILATVGDDAASGKLYLCLGSVDHGAMVLNMVPLGIFCENQLFGVDRHVLELVHITDPTQWLIIPSRPVCPN